MGRQQKREKHNYLLNCKGKLVKNKRISCSSITTTIQTLHSMSKLATQQPSSSLGRKEFNQQPNYCTYDLASTYISTPCSSKAQQTTTLNAQQQQEKQSGQQQEKFPHTPSQSNLIFQPTSYLQSNIQNNRYQQKQQQSYQSLPSQQQKSTTIALTQKSPNSHPLEGVIPSATITISPQTPMKFGFGAKPQDLNSSYSRQQSAVQKQDTPLNFQQNSKSLNVAQNQNQEGPTDLYLTSSPQQLKKGNPMRGSSSCKPVGAQLQQQQHYQSLTKLGAESVKNSENFNNSLSKIFFNSPRLKQDVQESLEDYSQYNNRLLQQNDCLNKRPTLNGNPQRENVLNDSLLSKNSKYSQPQKQLFKNSSSAAVSESVSFSQDPQTQSSLLPGQFCQPQPSSYSCYQDNQISSTSSLNRYSQSEAENIPDKKQLTNTSKTPQSNQTQPTVQIKNINLQNFPLSVIDLSNSQITNQSTINLHQQTDHKPQPLLSQKPERIESSINQQNINLTGYKQSLQIQNAADFIQPETKSILGHKAFQNMPFQQQQKVNEFQKGLQPLSLLSLPQNVQKIQNKSGGSSTKHSFSGNSSCNNFQNNNKTKENIPKSKPSIQPPSYKNQENSQKTRDNSSQQRRNDKVRISAENNHSSEPASIATIQNGKTKSCLASFKKAVASSTQQQPTNIYAAKVNTIMKSFTGTNSNNNNNSSTYGQQISNSNWIPSQNSSKLCQSTKALFDRKTIHIGDTVESNRIHKKLQEKLNQLDNCKSEDNNNNNANMLSQEMTKQNKNQVNCNVVDYPHLTLKLENESNKSAPQKSQPATYRSSSLEKQAVIHSHTTPSLTSQDGNNTSYLLSTKTENANMTPLPCSSQINHQFELNLYQSATQDVVTQIPQMNKNQMYPQIQLTLNNESQILPSQKTTDSQNEMNKALSSQTQNSLQGYFSNPIVSQYSSNQQGKIPTFPLNSETIPPLGTQSISETPLNPLLTQTLISNAHTQSNTQNPEEISSNELTKTLNYLLQFPVSTRISSNLTSNLYGYAPHNQTSNEISFQVPISSQAQSNDNNQNQLSNQASKANISQNQNTNAQEQQKPKLMQESEVNNLISTPQTSTKSIFIPPQISEIINQQNIIQKIISFEEIKPILAATVALPEQQQQSPLALQSNDSSILSQNFQLPIQNDLTVVKSLNSLITQVNQNQGIPAAVANKSTHKIQSSCSKSPKSNTQANSAKSQKGGFGTTNSTYKSFAFKSSANTYQQQFQAYKVSPQAQNSDAGVAFNRNSSNIQQILSTPSLTTQQLNQLERQSSNDLNDIPISNDSALNNQENLQQPTISNEKLYYVSSLANAYNNPEDKGVIPCLARDHLVQTMQSVSFSKQISQPTIAQIESKRISLPSLKSGLKKTIVFDLDETLIHCNENADVKSDIIIPITFPTGEQVTAGINVRPYAREILEELSKLFEILVFTASHSCYANVVLDLLDPTKKLISQRLFREHCIQTDEGVYVKDLRVIGNRNMKDILLVDNAAYSFGFQMDNGIPIIPFYDYKEDTELKHLSDYLKSVHSAKNAREHNKLALKIDLYSEYEDPNELLQSLYPDLVKA